MTWPRIVAAFIAAWLLVPTASEATSPVTFWNGKKTVTRPSSVLYTGDGTGYFVKLHWTSFGGATAVATGTDRLNNCTPSCAAGKFRSYPATLTLSKPIACHGERMYSLATVKVPRVRQANGQFPLYTRCHEPG
jgi:hypothetical protein